MEGRPNARLVIGKGGTISIIGDETLFLNFGSEERALEYFWQKMAGGRKTGSLPDASIKSFLVPRSFLDELRAFAVPERLSRQFPNRPIIVDPTRAADQYGLRQQQIDALERCLIQGSGRER